MLASPPCGEQQCPLGACSVSGEQVAGICAAKGSGGGTPAALPPWGLCPICVTARSLRLKLAGFASSEPFGTCFWSAPGKAGALDFSHDECVRQVSLWFLHAPSPLPTAGCVPAVPGWGPEVLVNEFIVWRFSLIAFIEHPQPRNTGRVMQKCLYCFIWEHG